MHIVNKFKFARVRPSVSTISFKYLLFEILRASGLEKKIKNIE